jgi:7-cyano-7-deazaguanine synthase
MKALLLSGGVDSTALAHWLRPDIALTIDYGQVVALAEIEASKAICAALGIPHRVLRINCHAIAAGQLADKPASKLSNVEDWWPYRNQLLITFAAAFFANEGLSELIIGTVKSDKIHRDGTAKFISSINRLLRLQEGCVSVVAPAILLTSEELLRKSTLPDEVLGWTFSCHTSPHPCGQCRGCAKRNKVLSAASSQLL